MAQPAAGTLEGVPKDIGNKMRSAIKAKLTELGCYVDDELPDYVMVMVANKRTRSQMEEDLQLFLGGNTELFVSWLHQVLRRLQEVSVKTAPKPPEGEEPKISKPRSSKERKAKDKKDKKASKEKHKKSDGSIKKSKKETRKKDRESRKKVPKKSKKKSKNDGIIRPNVPPLLMNLEKESEPSITDVFAGQILKNHGITLEQNVSNDAKVLEDVKPIRKALKRTKFPIIDPATVTNVTDLQPLDAVSVSTTENVPSAIEMSSNVTPAATVDSDQDAIVSKRMVNLAATDIQNLPREDQIREMNEIEAKIQGLKKKLADQLDSMSEDEDFLNIRTEAEELMNDFAEDVLQEITAAQSSTTHTPPMHKRPEPEPAEATAAAATTVAAATVTAVAAADEQLPLIELQLPKRPMRDRLGARPEPVRPDKRRLSNERLTPEKELPGEERSRSVRSRLGDGEHRKRHVDLPERTREEPAGKRLLSRVAATRRGGEERARAAPASVVRVRPRPRPAPGAPAPALLMRAVADAHKSLLNVAPKPDGEPHVKRALVLPMRRTVESQNIVIQVQSERIASLDTSDCEIDLDTESLTELTADESYKPSAEYAPELPKRSVSSGRTHHAPSHTSDSSALDDDVITIHNPTVGKERGPQFVVTLDGLDPNVFLAKKLKTEGITDEIAAHPRRTPREASADHSSTDKPLPEHVPATTEDPVPKPQDANSSSPKDKSPLKTGERALSVTIKTEDSPLARTVHDDPKTNSSPEQKRLDPQVVTEKRGDGDSPSAKKRRVSPIVFDVEQREKARREREAEKTRERKESVGSDITITTASTRKYDSLPSLPPEKRRLPCRAFPACRFGAACAFSHPRCKFGAACSRRDCSYSHPAASAAAAAAAAAAVAPTIASHVVAVGNYKSVSAAPQPAVCRFYPACAHPACPFLHPKPCRYGRACLNRLQCNFFHPEAAAAARWRSPFQV